MNRARAAELLKKFESIRILTVGDLMLDRYIMGNVSRISPEAPVPVVHVSSEKVVPGGASNVALNIGALRGKAALAGLTGNDAESAELSGLLSQYQVSTAGILPVDSIRTTVKTRVIAERQQVVRIDWEDELSFTDEMLAQFREQLKAEVAKSDGVIIEDYGKGVIVQEVVDTILAEAGGKKIPVGLDPKDNHVLNVAGITLATPNRKEAFTSAGIPETRPGRTPLEDRNLLKVGKTLLDKWKPELLIISLGGDGMMLFEGDQDPIHVPTRAREVFDVSGAGDTVIATCVLARAAGATFVEAAEIANYAAGVVVAKLGTATCSQDELLAWVPE